MDRRSLLIRLGVSLIAAPAIVRSASLMPMRGIKLPYRLTVADIIRCRDWLREMDKARQEVERACGIPEGYWLIVL